ncbi:MAG: sigma-E factor negative regulatory protein [Burkholderiaceae bacterium]
MNISRQNDDPARSLGSLPHEGAQLDGPEGVSALVDGRLRGTAFARMVEAVHSDAQMRANWQTYHLIGDLLRQGEVASRVRASDGLAARVAARLAAEPLLVPHGPMATETEIDTTAAMPAAPAGATNEMHPPLAQGLRQAANDPLWRWRAFAGVATVMAFAAVGWNLLGGGVATPAAGTPMLAQGEPPRQMLRDPRLDELLAAHEQSAGISALQMPAGFLRNATFEGRGR